MGRGWVRSRRAPTERRHSMAKRQWAGVGGRDVCGLGVGHTRLFTVSDRMRSRATGVRRASLSRNRGPGLEVSAYHQPVMLAEAMKFLSLQGGGVFLDATVGGGGHAEGIVAASSGVRLLGVDRDPAALAFAARRLERYADRVLLRAGDFAESDELFDLVKGTLAGVLVDLGVSSHQIDFLERGFSFRQGAPLDMRMQGPDADEATAADLLNAASATDLSEIFRRFGEVRGARRLAAEIIRRRKTQRFATSDDLREAVEAAFGRPARPGLLAPIFQALRIAVNHELESLERALPLFRDLLEPAGRLVVIAYHSLEDRAVKRAFREWSQDCICPPRIPVCRCRGRALGRELTRRPVRPSTEELASNPRARSARLRAWEKATEEAQ